MKKLLSLVVLSLLSFTSVVSAMESDNQDPPPHFGRAASVIPKDLGDAPNKFSSALNKLSSEQSEMVKRHGSVIFKNIGSLDRAACLASLSTFTLDQLDVLGRYGESLLPPMLSRSDHKFCLEALKRFSPEKLEVLGRHAPEILKKIGDYERAHCLRILSDFSPEQLDTLGRYAPAIFMNTSDCHWFVACLYQLNKFSPKKLETLGRHAPAIYSNLCEIDRPKVLYALSEFSAETIDMLGRYGEILIFRDGLPWKSLGELPLDKLELLGRTASVIFQDRKGFARLLLSSLINFSIQQLEALRKFAPKTVENIVYRDCFSNLIMFSPEQLVVVGKYEEGLIPKMRTGTHYYYWVYYRELDIYLKVLSEFSSTRLEVIGRYAKALLPQSVFDEMYTKRSELLKGQMYLKRLELLKSLSIEDLGNGKVEVW